MSSERRQRKLADSFIGFLADQTDENRRRFEGVLETIAEVSTSLGEAAVLGSVVNRAVALTRAERGYLMLRDRWDNLEPRVAHDKKGRDLPVGEIFSRSVCDRVAETGTPVREEYDPRKPLSDSIREGRVKSSMCVPLRVRGRVIGVLYVDTRDIRTRFTESDLGLFKALAYALALGVEFARVAKKERSLAVARAVQRHLLPEGPHDWPGLEIHGVSRPWEAVGGDFFDYLELPDRRLGLAIGDVSGKGLSAALLMATARGQLRAVATLEPDPARVMSRLNRLLAPDFGAARFMSIFLAVVEGRSLRYVGAGHCPPLLLRARTDRIQALDIHGPALGPMPDKTYETSGPVVLDTGDVLLLYTDGVTEARDRDGRMFGESRLRDVLKQARDLPARGIVERILDRVDRDCDDDLTLVVVKAV